MRHRVAVLSLFLILLFAAMDTLAQLPNVSVHRTNGNEVTVRFDALTNSYYAVQRSTNLSMGFVADHLFIGSNVVAQFRFSTEASAASFFRIREFPLFADPNLHSVLGFDHDGDGIDDAWEMLHDLNPLVSADAIQIVPGEGRTWLEFYRDQLPLIASFSTADSRFVETEGVVGIPVRFSKPYVGTLKLQVTGTAIEGRDYQSSLTKIPGDPFTGTITVNGSSALIPITLLANDAVDPSRTLALSLRQQTGINAYRAEGLPSHVMTITEGDLGVYSGVLTFTNTSIVGSQRFKFAVRTTAAGLAVAHFDVENSLLFQDSFEIPCTIGRAGDFQFDSSAIIQGGLRGAAAIGRPVSWSLSAGATSPPNEVQSLPGIASITMDITGLAAGVFPARLRGQLIYTYAD